MVEKILDWWFDYVIALPLTCTQKSPQRIIRMVGLILLFLYLPVAMFAMLPVIPLILAMIVEDAWKGE